MDRPVGAIIVAVLVFLRGLFGVADRCTCAGIWHTGTSGRRSDKYLIGHRRGHRQLVWGGLKLVAGVIFLGLGYGLMKGAPMGVDV